MMTIVRIPPEQRFWSHVDKTPTCWVWTASQNEKGYGQFWATPQEKLYAHRYSYELHFGPIPPGKLIDHRCHNHSCVNPSHIRLATVKQNGENRSGAAVNSKSGVRGVTWDGRRNKWRATTGHHGKLYHGGYFETLEDAERGAMALRAHLFTHCQEDA